MATLITPFDRKARITDIVRLDGLRRSSIRIAATGKGQRIRAGEVIAEAILGPIACTVGANAGGGRIDEARTLPGAQRGVYHVVIMGAAEYAGRYLVFDPSGAVIGERSVTEPFEGPQITFSFAHGTRDHALGDTFTVEVATGSGLIRTWHPAATDGTDRAVGVALAECFVNDERVVITCGGDADSPPAIARHALRFFEGATETQQQAAIDQLTALGIQIVDQL